MRNKYLKEGLKIILICLGGVIMVVGVNYFLKPAGVFATGLFGFAQELSQIFFHDDLHINMFFWMINIPLIVFGYFKVGKKFLLRTFLSICAISLTEQFLTVPSTPLIEDRTLAVITGSILMGAGTGLALSRGGSTGGVDIVSMYISLVKGKSFGMVNVLVNSVVILIAVILNKNIEVGIYMLISIYIGGLIIDQIHNYNQKQTLFIVTEHPQKIIDAITANFYRGSTIFESMGGYSKRQNKTIMITVSKAEINNIIKCIKQADPNCFINVYKVQRVIGTFNDIYLEML